MEPAPKISIIFGDLDVESCWLSTSGTSLSVLGFLHSGYRTRNSALHLGDLGSQSFRPQTKVPTLQTDLFLWGCVIYEIMTGHWPGEGQGLSLDEQSSLVSHQQWPRLESMYLGDVVRKCWMEEITGAAELLVAVRTAITDLGVVIGSNEEILDLGLEGLAI